VYLVHYPVPQAAAQIHITPGSGATLVFREKTLLPQWGLELFAYGTVQKGRLVDIQAFF